jgi:hypothetical protein
MFQFKPHQQNPFLDIPPLSTAYTFVKTITPYLTFLNIPYKQVSNTILQLFKLFDDRVYTKPLAISVIKVTPSLIISLLV